MHIEFHQEKKLNDSKQQLKTIGHNPFPRSVMAKELDCGLEVSSDVSCSITFTFGLIPFGKVRTLSSSKLWDK